MVTTSLQRKILPEYPKTFPQKENVTNGLMFSCEMLNFLFMHGYSKNSLAQELGIAVSTINRILRGASNPGNHTFAKLLRLYCATCYKDA